MDIKKNKEEKIDNKWQYIQTGWKGTTGYLGTKADFGVNQSKNTSIENIEGELQEESMSAKQTVWL